MHVIYSQNLWIVGIDMCVFVFVFVFVLVLVQMCDHRITLTDIELYSGF